MIVDPDTNDTLHIYVAWYIAFIGACEEKDNDIDVRLLKGKPSKMNTKDAYNDKTHEWDDFKHKTNDFVGFTSNGLSFYVNGTITDGCKVIMEHS